jgi:hypothetical protein
VARPTTGDEAVKAGKNDKKRMKSSEGLMVIPLQERFALLCTQVERLPQLCGSANPQFTMPKRMSPQWLSPRLPRSDCSLESWEPGTWTRLGCRRSRNVVHGGGACAGDRLHATLAKKSRCELINARHTKGQCRCGDSPAAQFRIP